MNIDSIAGYLNTIIPALDLDFGEDLIIKLATILAGQVPAEATKDYTMNKLARMQHKMIQTKIDKGIPLTPLESAISRIHKPNVHTSARDTIKEQQTAARQEAVQTKRGRPKVNAAAA